MKLTMSQTTRAFALLLLGAGVLSGCASPEYVGNSAKGFWSDSSFAVGPSTAFQKAMPHLEATWEARCEELHHHDEWCDKQPIDHMMLVGKTYYLTRTSYPYKTQSAYLDYAVRVNAESGEVTPLK